MPGNVRVRFAPSPTGGLHLGGVRTVLYNYLFARKHGGAFILRIEDTDQARFVPGAEDYIHQCLEWCGLSPDESPIRPGSCGPYRQSERKDIYRQYAEQLVANGHAYYAFDTPEELENMRTALKTDLNPSPQYNQGSRLKMKNSLTLPPEHVQQLLASGTPHVVRVKMPDDEDILFNDMIRGDVQFNSSQVDDKVLLKGDGMPTYHLAVVVDDYLMKITHAFRGEEWLPSAPVHVLLWRYFGWQEKMPKWAHLPLILKPDGKGKLSKRDGDRLGFPVFAMDWKDPATGEVTTGFRERGFLPEAFVNLLALLGWNDGTEQEIFTIAELIERFSLERVHKGGAKFNYEKAKWFNHEWIKRTDNSVLAKELAAQAAKHNLQVSWPTLERICTLVKDRCMLLSELWDNSYFFFEAPGSIEMDAIAPKWNDQKREFFLEYMRMLENGPITNVVEAESNFKHLATSRNIKPGDVLLPFRVMLVGKKIGPGVFDIADTIGKEETVRRISRVLDLLA
jgi:glutamyl-tRNA synthetase